MSKQKTKSRLRRWQLGLVSLASWWILAGILVTIAGNSNISWLGKKEALPGGGFAISFTLWTILIPLAISLGIYALLNYIYRDRLPRFRWYNPDNYRPLPTGKFIKYSLIYGAAAIGLGTGLGILVEKIIQPPHTQNAITSFIAGNPIPGFLLACIIAPMWEEPFFRGFVFKRLANKWGYTAGSVVAAIIFALAHTEAFDIRSIAYIILVLGGVALLLNYTFYKYRNLALNMTIHALLNFSSFVLLLKTK